MNTHPQIVATIGPAVHERERVAALLAAGADLIRINFSWGSYQDDDFYIDTVRQEAEKAGRHIPIIQDLSGPRMQEASGHEFDAKRADAEGGIVTPKDLADLDYGARKQVEYVAQSYVGSADDVRALRAEMKKRGMKARIIAKIERAAAVEALASIVAEADAVMVARGDLGNEVPLEKIPYVELAIIRAARAAGKPVITATQMMLSMVDNPTPTRAEVTDVAYAVLHGSDAVMLSEESARGKHPIEAVSMMRRVISEAEKHGHHFDVHAL